MIFDDLNMTNANSNLTSIVGNMNYELYIEGNTKEVANVVRCKVPLHSSLV